MFTLAGMTGLRVSEVAARAGVTTSAVRFYERAGLLSPARRTANGYRVFDESALDDLALISRAKGIGMSLDEIAELVSTWHGSECHDVHSLLREHLAAQEARLNNQMAEITAFQQQSQAAFRRLTAHEPAPGHCLTDCPCTEAFEPEPGNDGFRPAGCALDDGELACRVGQWQALGAAALSAERDGGVLRFTLEPAMIPAAAELIAAETRCCPEATFSLEAREGLAFLTARFPAEAAGPVGDQDAEFGRGEHLEVRADDAKGEDRPVE